MDRSREGTLPRKAKSYELAAFIKCKECDGTGGTEWMRKDRPRPWNCPACSGHGSLMVRTKKVLEPVFSQELKRWVWVEADQ